MSSTVLYSGDGSNQSFVITYPYVSRDFVKVYVDGALQTEGVGYTFASDTSITVTPAPPNGTNNVELRRVTSTDPVVDFVNGAALSESDLDDAFNQALHLNEEAIRDAISGMGKVGANWDAENVRITNVSPPVADTDVATKASIAAQVTSASSSAATATSQALLAQSFAANASSSASAAALDEGIASQAADDAEAARDDIMDAYPLSGMTQHEVLRADSATTVVADRLSNLVLTSQSTLSTESEDIISIPNNDFDHFVIEVRDFAPASGGGAVDTAGTLIAQFSTDGGSTYHSGNSDYTWVVDSTVPNGTLGTSNPSDDVIQLACSLNGNRVSPYLKIELFCGDGSSKQNTVRVDGVIWHANGAAFVVGCGELDGDEATYNRVTHVRLAWNNNETFGSGTRDLFTRITW
tara:strand:+ start:15732 stop:16958 length:1227 start_codon:yes stop_codon:yes gene_type:complete